MDNTVYMLWFEQEREDCDDCELFIGVYSSEPEAKAAIERLKNQKGFGEFQEGFHIYPYELNEDNWTNGFMVDRATPVPSWLGNDHSAKK